MTTDEVEKKLKSYRNNLLLIEYQDRKVYNEVKVKEILSETVREMAFDTKRRIIEVEVVD